MHLPPLLPHSWPGHGQLQPTNLYASATHVPIQLPGVSPRDDWNPDDTVMIKLKARPVAALHLHASGERLKQVK